MEKKLAHQLRDVTEATAQLYGNDLQIAERLLSHLLTFETQQSGFGLTATQDAYFNEVRKTSCLVCTQETLTGDPSHGHTCQQRKSLFTEKLVILWQTGMNVRKSAGIVVKLICMEMTLNKL